MEERLGEYEGLEDLVRGACGFFLIPLVLTRSLRADGDVHGKLRASLRIQFVHT